MPLCLISGSRESPPARLRIERSGLLEQSKGLLYNDRELDRRLRSSLKVAIHSFNLWAEVEVNSKARKGIKNRALSAIAGRPVNPTGVRRHHCLIDGVSNPWRLSREAPSRAGWKTNAGRFPAVPRENNSIDRESVPAIRHKEAIHEKQFSKHLQVRPYSLFHSFLYRGELGGDAGPCGSRPCGSIRFSFI